MLCQLSNRNWHFAHVNYDRWHQIKGQKDRRETEMERKKMAHKIKNENSHRRRIYYSVLLFSWSDITAHRTNVYNRKYLIEWESPFGVVISIVKHTGRHEISRIRNHGYSLRTSDWKVNCRRRIQIKLNATHISGDWDDFAECKKRQRENMLKLTLYRPIFVQSNCQTRNNRLDTWKTKSFNCNKINCHNWNEIKN